MSIDIAKMREAKEAYDIALTLLRKTTSVSWQMRTSTLPNLWFMTL